MISQTKVELTDVVLRLVGESGEGAVSLGDLMVKMFVTMGLDVYTFHLPRRDQGRYGHVSDSGALRRATVAWGWSGCAGRAER